VELCRPGWSLPGTFYADARIYEADLDRIWGRSWLFAGHACQIPKTGDYFTLQIDRDSIIVIRGEDGSIRCLHNVCRHRGSLVCTESTGQKTRLVCPYHQWVYDTKGVLLSCRGMPADLDKSAFGLAPVHTREVAGLIYINLAEAPSPFEPAEALLGALAQPQGFHRAKVARLIDYTIHANWKLVWENNRECYHCNQNHPQYIKANFDHYNADDTSPAIRSAMDEAVISMEEKLQRFGLAVSHKQTGMTLFPDAEKDVWFSANRTTLVDGWVTESIDGKQVAPLMGDYASPEVGTLRMRSLPNFWNHSSCDHGVTTQLFPAGPNKTLARVLWLVHEDAVEGRDYTLDRLLPFWQLTSEQDWVICENQQRGVSSSAYRPGPYSTFKEYNVDNFVRWYLQKLVPNSK
jgi:Rieske 2Fe-2S family protein